MLVTTTMTTSRLSLLHLLHLTITTIIISALLFIHSSSATTTGALDTSSANKGDEFKCEDVAVEKCAFAVSSAGERCVLETNIFKDGAVHLECQTSKITTGRFNSWIEDDACIKSCGLSRMFVGLSTDFLGEYDLQQYICSRSCLDGCSNIIELFTELANEEGVSLQSLCDAQRFSARKLIQDVSWDVTPNVAQSPTSLPSY